MKLESTFRGKTYEEFKALLRDGYRSEVERMDLSGLEPFAKQIWSALVFAEFNEKERGDSNLIDKKHHVVKQLIELQGFINELLSCRKNTMKRWKDLGSYYRDKVSAHYQDILLEALDEFHSDLETASTNPKYYYEYWDFVMQAIAKLPTRESFHIDKRTKLIPIEDIENCAKALKSVITDTKKLIPEEHKTIDQYYPGKVTRRIFEKDIPRTNELFEQVYYLLYWLGIIPDKVKADHDESKDPDCRKNYIRGLVNIDSKHPQK